MTDHAVLLDRLAKLAVHTGLNLEAGQELLLAAPLESAPLVRLIAEHAYKAGAKLVTPLFADDATNLARFRHAPADSFDYAAQWLFDATATAMRNGAARLTIAGDDPNLLSGQDPDKSARANRARAIASRGPLELLTSFETNWSIVPYATTPWARLVFPGVSDAEAVGLLWDAIFAITRADRDDPVAAWAEHGATLQARTRYLTEAQFDALRFRGPGTDLRVGLSQGHIWLGGPTATKKGLVTIPNMPTEEVFTTPHFAQTEGYVRSTKPLSYSGTLIKDIAVRFEQGRIVHAQASAGLEVLEKVLGTDPGRGSWARWRWCRIRRRFRPAGCCFTILCSMKTRRAIWRSGRLTASAWKAAPRRAPRSWNGGGRIRA